MDKYLYPSADSSCAASTNGDDSVSEVSSTRPFQMVGLELLREEMREDDEPYLMPKSYIGISKLLC
jgi:hypothetical protein